MLHEFIYFKTYPHTYKYGSKKPSSKKNPKTYPYNVLSVHILIWMYNVKAMQQLSPYVYIRE